MKLERISDDKLLVELSEGQLRVILSSLREIGEAVQDFEFYARVGAPKHDVHKLCVDLRNEMEAAAIEI